ncbi:MAG: UDP-N-acetylmuramoyl-L-alanine--D-glutamate ligase [Clostridium sp.]|nr:UDP-N-acetylmuramoyl-L-alanine--D-glutamate ligase [Clostridium sp.]MCM1398245.1 UDP-N-acetylmuramoyl-L-alanine--D-glutamate ligase [Clostridium sp.]MCM1460341.1 UDP-N-acetylmuramoyl-L-alanine--D-glutamate ligase [Bacteroides sp.]
MFDKKVLVAGAGKSGISAAKLLLRNNARVILFDENKELDVEDVRKKITDGKENERLEIVVGKLREDTIKQCEIMVISPGIPTDADFAIKVKQAGVLVWSEIELAYFFEKGSVAAITGTNGKTTTTTLVGEIIKAYNEKTFVVGNIGTPYTSLADSTNGDSVTVAEISSFQLETIHKFKPRVSAILNITPDHLNRHYTFENYAGCKLDITKNQTGEDYAVLNYDDAETMKLADKITAKHVLFSRTTRLKEGVYVEDGTIVICDADGKKEILPLKDIKLLGNHNIENVLAAVGISYYMGVPADIIRKVCTEFQGVVHRIEYVATVGGVAYYNDSKGTNPDAAIKAVQAMTTDTLLIGGGYDKHSAYDEWIESFDGKIKYLVLIGETAKDIEACANKHGFHNTIILDSLEDAVKFCHEHAVTGDAVLLSPACASWGMFDNYEQRGDMFKSYVHNL